MIIQNSTHSEKEKKMYVEKEWLETLKILILYKFANKGTAESTTDEIYRIFMNSRENKTPVANGYHEVLDIVPHVDKTPDVNNSQIKKEILKGYSIDGMDECSNCKHNRGEHNKDSCFVWGCNCKQFVLEKENEK